MTGPTIDDVVQINDRSFRKSPHFMALLWHPVAPPRSMIPNSEHIIHPIASHAALIMSEYPPLL
jgi:hypothetical protein